MKKIIILLSLILVISGCTKNNKQIEGTYKSTSKDFSVASLTINEDETFTFYYDLASSHQDMGNYTKEDNMLICTCKDCDKVFYFKINKNGTLRFDKDKSSDLIHYSDHNSDTNFKLKKAS